jgi:hypothetical protein
LGTSVRIGFLVTSMGSTQLAYHILREAPAVLGVVPQLDILAFVQNVSKPWTIPPFALLNISEAFGFDGVAVATDLNTARKMRSFPGPRRRYFYAWDLEWVHSPGLDHEGLAEIYADVTLPIVARSEPHARVIERCWGRPVRAVVEHCDMARWMKVIEDDDKRP